MRFYGDIKFDGSEGTLGQIVQPGISTETTFPENAQVGRIVFVNERVWIMAALNNGNPVWVPLTNKIDTYVHNQNTAASTWTVDHNLNTTSPMVQVFDDATQKLIIPGDVEVTSNNQVVITIGTAITGRAIVMFGDPTIGVVAGAQVLQPAQMTYTHTQSTGSTAWVVKHNLGYNPIVRVFDSTGTEVQPASIIHDSIFQTTIQFSSSFTGTARFA